jgi:pimeloyl-ACP methyl ester carboxylesterase
MHAHDIGTAIDYEVHGPTEAPGVVMTHGGGLNRAMFEPQLPALSDDFRVVTWDMPGHGRSAPLEANLDVPTVADQMIAIMAAEKIEQAVAVGHSLGSFVVQHAALRHPDRVNAIVSVGGMAIDEPMGGLELFAFRAAASLSSLFPADFIFARSAQEKATTDAARQFFHESMRDMGKEQFLRMLGGQLDACAIDVTEPPRQPLLITHGEHEMPKSLVEANRRWHAAVPGSRYAEVPDAGHNATMDNPEAFNEVLLAFLHDVT